MSSIILNTDSYKTSHFEQYPPLTEKINSYIKARGIDDSFPRVKSTLFFGMQMFIKKYLLTPITKEDIREAEEIFDLHGVPFNRAGWETILYKHGGYLPIEIYALPEGLHVPLRTPLVQVRNTDESLPWLTSYVETALLRAIWYPTTVATLSSHIKNVVLRDYINKTAEDESVIDFMLHDFGARGASSLESAGIGGLAHLVNFKGTDTIEALVNARKYYHASMPGFSIPAAEHSTITSWGRDGEYQAYNNMVDKFGGKLYAVVSDSYDLYNAIENIWSKQLRDKIISKAGRVVIRPDSGDPLVVVPKSIELLGAGFGYTVNKKGYKVLHPSVRLIQGDGVNVKSIDGILYELMKAGWSAENVVFGMGGALLQKVDRDTLKFAMKASAINKSGHWTDVYKEPKTDPGKNSKKGVLSVMDNFVTIRAEDIYLTNKYLGQTDQLGLIFDNGDLIVDETFDTIRERAKVV